MYRCVDCHKIITNNTSKAASMQTIKWRYKLITTSQECYACLKRTQVMGHMWWKVTQGHDWYRCQACHNAVVGTLPHSVSRTNNYIKALREEVIEQPPIHPKNKSGYKYVECGTAPTSVQCACFGFPSYERRVTKEIEKWSRYLCNMFGNPPGDSGFYKTTEQHSTGPEHTVRFYFDKDNEEHITYASRLKHGMPETWEEQREEEIKVKESHFPDSKGRWSVRMALSARKCTWCSEKISHGDKYRYNSQSTWDALCTSCFTKKIVKND